MEAGIFVAMEIDSISPELQAVPSQLVLDDSQ
jgi:hypothetical protein